MAHDNPMWVEKRIANELLLKPGLRVSPHTLCARICQSTQPGKNIARCGGRTAVLGIMHIPFTRGPGHYLSVPVGCELCLKAPQAQKLNVPYQSRSQLARAIFDCVAEQVPGRPIWSLADG